MSAYAAFARNRHAPSDDLDQKGDDLENNEHHENARFLRYCAPAADDADGKEKEPGDDHRRSGTVNAPRTDENVVFVHVLDERGADEDEGDGDENIADVEEEQEKFADAEGLDSPLGHRVVHLASVLVTWALACEEARASCDGTRLTALYDTLYDAQL